MRTRIKRWSMRASVQDIERIKELTNLLQVSETEAVRIAISYTLALLLQETSNIQAILQFYRTHKHFKILLNQ